MASPRIGNTMPHRLLLLFALLGSLFAGTACADIRSQFIATDPVALVADTAAGQVAFSVEIADDPGERERGLMFREDMPDRHGMLFVFERTDEVGFWMKDTPLPLDLVFIGEDGVIGAIRRGEPFSEALIAPPVLTRFVLELKSGTALQTGLTPGVRLRHPVIDQIAG